MNLHEALKIVVAETEGTICLGENELEELHLCLLEMIKEFDAFCNDNDIAYSLGAGNILGAIRHKGFIPWDDDIDITMTRSEYMKLVKCFPNFNEEKYYLCKPGDKGYILHYPRIFKRNTKFRSLLSVDGGHNELYIDVFIVENIPDVNILRKIHGILCTVLLGIGSSVRVYYCRKTLEEYSRNSEMLQKEIKKRCNLGRFLSFIPIETWMKLSDKCFSACKNNNSIDVSIPSGAKHYFGEIYSREKICRCKRKTFENLKLPIPEDADYYLRKRYGVNYMVPPEESKREHRFLIDFKI